MLVHLVWFANLIATNCLELLDRPPATPKISYYAGRAAEIGKSEQWLKLTEEMPYKYNILSNPSDTRTYIIRVECLSSNADYIKWEFRHSDDNEWGTEVPSFFREETTVVRNRSSVSITQQSYLFNDFKMVNGSYRCIAKHTEKNYVTSSPQLRIIVAHAIKKPKDPLRTDVTYTFDQGEPGMIPCRQEKALIVPGDSTRFSKALLITTSWRSKIDSPKTRLRVNYITGDVYMAYFKANDAGADRYFELHFSLSTTSFPLTSISKVDDITITKRRVNAGLTIVYPRYREVNSDLIAIQDDAPTCTIGELCYIQTIFAGRLAGHLPVRAVSPNGTIYKFPDDSTGFFLTAQSFEEGGVYKIELYNESESSVAMSLLLQVNIISYPQLLRGAYFPHEQFTRAGDDVSIACKTNHTSNTTFYINDEIITRYPNKNLKYDVGADEFTIQQIKRNQTAAVQCMAHGPAGKSFFNTLLIVYEKPSVIQSPSGSLNISQDNITNLHSKNLTCSIRLDRTEWANIYWRWSKTDEKKNVNRRSFGNFNKTVHTYITVVLKPDIANTYWWCEVEYTAEFTQGRPAIAKGAPLYFQDSFSVNETNWNLVTIIVLVAVGGLILVLAAIACVYFSMCKKRKNKVVKTIDVSKTIKADPNKKTPFPVTYQGPVVVDPAKTKKVKNSTVAIN